MYFFEKLPYVLSHPAGLLSWKNYDFWKMSMSQKFRNVSFSETKAPQGAFENLPQENKFIFLIISKMDFFPTS